MTTETGTKSIEHAPGLPTAFRPRTRAVGCRTGPRRNAQAGRSARRGTGEDCMIELVVCP
jgi:hypothetical protein